MDVFQLEQDFQFVTRLCPTNTIRKNYFIAACKLLDDSVCIQNIEEDNPYGGTIGIGNSKLDILFRWSKIFRLHAIMHDAAGYMRRQHNVGPGYCYVFSGCPINSCLLGHLSGILYCSFLKFFSPIYKELIC